MKPLILVLNLTFASDAASTHYALSHHLAKEVVLPTQNVIAIDSIIAAESISTSYELVWLDKNKHPKATKILGWSIIAIRSAVVANNINNLRRK